MSNILTVRTLRNNLFKFIESLPDDIKNYIYTEFIEIDFKYEIINKYFLTKCGCLTKDTSSVLAKYVKIIINNEKLRDLFLKRSINFVKIYEYKLKNKKFFSLIEGYYNDFALAWIWAQYH